MRNVEIISTDQPTAWRSALPSHNSVFGSLEYARIIEQHSGDTAQLFVFQHQGGLIVYPFFRRSVNTMDFSSGTEAPLWDTVSPEYTGPMELNPGLSDSAGLFADAFSAFCRDNGIVAEFAHLHPFHSCSGCLERSNIEDNREIVYIDLLLSEEDLWRKSFTHACRKNIARSQRENVRVFQAETPEHVKEFHRIYTLTMRRNNAHARYYYPLDYFMSFFEQMPGNARFVLAEKSGYIVAGTLYLYDDTDVYSYLGGADERYQEARPTNAIVYDTVLWAKGQGRKRLILGGGYRAEDGIFRFKSSFSPRRVVFRVYKRVHLPVEYARLCQEWSEYYGSVIPDTDYFPQYRAAIQLVP